MLTRARPVDYSRPPSPHCVLRGHLHPLSQLCFSPTRSDLLFSGDSSGVVALWNLKTYRTRLVWKPHQDGILTIAQLGQSTLMTHARDNKLHLYNLKDLLHRTTTALGSFEHPLDPSLVAPTCSLDVNALNFCSLSLLQLFSESVKPTDEALVAVPSLTKDDQVDIFHVPTASRIHRSVGISSLMIGGGGGADSEQKTGSVMAVHLLYLPTSSLPSAPPPAENSKPGRTTSNSRFKGSDARPLTLHILVGYESGQLALLEFRPTSNFSVPRPTSATARDAQVSPIVSDGDRLENITEIAFPKPGKMIDENEGWDLVWVEKSHRDAVMSIEVSKDGKFAYSVGVDHVLVKYRLWDINEEEATLPRCHAETTTSPGKSIIKSRSSRRANMIAGSSGKGPSKEILAVGGWNGEVMIYSNETLEPLACLSHHRNSVQTVDFAPVDSLPTLSSSDGSESDSDEDGAEEAGMRGVLASGGSDTKICLWRIYPP